MRVQSRVDRVIIHDDNPNQGYIFLGGVGGGGNGGRVEVQVNQTVIDNFLLSKFHQY